MTLNQDPLPDPALAVSITQAASSQTYYTIRFLVDHDLVPEAYRAYAYFRWVDDQLDQGGMERPERLDFVHRQKSLVDLCYQGRRPQHLAAEEYLLTELIRADRGKASGLQSYIRNMMAVMAFDAERRGRLISQEQLANYSRWLSIAVTEALHYFIGHNCASPRNEARYMAATAAHVTHMLRDTLEDVQAGYFNIPREILQAHDTDPWDIAGEAYRAWVRGRVQLARASFKSGRDYLAQVANVRCRLAGYAYIARFAGLLDAIQQDGYQLRSKYPECKTLKTGLQMSWSAFALMIKPHGRQTISRALTMR